MSYGLSSRKSFTAACIMALALLLPVTGHAGQWSVGFGGNNDNWQDDNRGNRDHDDGRRRGDDGDRGRNNGWNRTYNNGSFGGPMYFNDYRPPVVTRYVYSQPVIVYQSPPVIYDRDAVYYRNVPRYAVGQQLPEFYAVPTNVVAQIGPPPQGYYYSMGPRRVYVVSHQDNAITQIIDLLLR